MKHRIAVISFSVVLAGAAGALVLGRKSLAHWSSNAAAAASGAPSAPARARPALSRAGWEPGSKYVHTLDYRASFGQAKTDDSAAANRLVLALSGRWETRVSELHDGEVRVQIALRQPKFEMGTTGTVPDEVVHALEAPFCVDYDEHGRAERLYVRPNLDATALGMLRELVSATQFTAPQTPSATWNAVESDTAGDYQARYQAGPGGAFFRQKSGYVRLAGRAGTGTDKGASPVVEAYSAQFQLDDWGRMQNLTLTSDVKTPVLGSDLSFESESQLKLAQVERSRDTAGLPISVADLVVTTLTPGARDIAEAGQQSDRALVAGADVDSLLKELSASKDETAGPGVRARLAALFRLDPAAVGTARARLTPGNAQTILGALAEAGTPEAQKVLASVIGDAHRDPAERKAAIQAALTLENPTHETSEALKSLLDSDDPELKGDASLALGVVAGRMSADQPDEAHAVVDRIGKDYAAATTPDEQLRVVGSLGNTRSAEALPVITQALQSENPAVRAAGAAALRFVPDASVDGTLSKLITSDADASVRSAALMASGYRSYDPLASAFESIAKGPDPGMRSELVSTLSNMVAHDSGSMVLLDWMAQNDPKSDIRAQAQRVLDSSSSG